MELSLHDAIIEASTQVFASKGLRFTMQDVATQMHISKKTIYTEFYSKEELLQAMLDYGFGKIRREKDAIIRDPKLTNKEKLEKVLIALPGEYELLDFRRLDELQEKYPKVQERLEGYLMGGWEPTLRLIEEGKRDGWIRSDVNIDIMRIMFTASIQHFLLGETAGADYGEALHEMTTILMYGIAKK